MQLRTTSKFIIGAICGTLLTLSFYSLADNNDSSAENVSKPTTSATIPVDDINNFAKVYAITKNFYVESTTDSKLIKGAITGMLSNLDPHSSYLDQKDFKQLNEMTSGSFAGIGIEISRDKDSGGIKIVAPIDGTPAYIHGIKSGDIIVKIDGQPVSGLALDEAIKKMRGKVGTKVLLTIVRAGQLQPLKFNISRANILVKSVKYTILDKDYAYIRITNFQSDTITELVAALNDVYKKNNALKGLILDLRDDPGGLLQAAVGVTGAFIPQNSLVVYTKGRAPDTNQKFYVMPKYYNLSDSTANNDILAKVPQIFKSLPIVVLVNQGSASASEIVSGALQDYKRGKIVGTKTFGKGSVQSVIPLSGETAVKLTTALYYTPRGRSIQAKGIKPDIIVQNEYSDLYDSWDLSEAALDKHIDNPTHVVSVTKDKDNTPIITPPKQIKTEAELKARLKEQISKRPKVTKPSLAIVDLKNDFQLQWALNIIQGKPLPSGKPITKK
jgi:carboxyl-terminal processing protease